MKYFINRFLIGLMFICSSIYAEADNNWYMSASANINFNAFSKSQNLDTQTELGVFVDADYLENYALSAGLIYQNQGQKSFDNISNNILFLGARYHIYPESVPGRLSLSLETYTESENSTVKTTRTQTPGPGSGGPPTVTITTELINDSMDIINPVISYLNYTKTFYADLGYTQSEYGSTDPEIGKLKVKQWAPTIGFSFNDQYDWLQFRYYNIELSNDARSPGVTKTSASEFKLTHWLNNNENFSFNNIQFIMLIGERLFAVDADARKVYNLADMQTSTYSIGGNWKNANKNEFYLYAGVENYEDPESNENYINVFLYSGYKKFW
ncbi:MAG: hypothetical protein OQK98_02845 [Gammaproteobacteria bacterium]|nr:hypothetical protein [Gammaproteobacteria bacterium]